MEYVNPPWLSYLVGVLFSMLILGGPLLVSLIYPLTAAAGGWSTFKRRDYPEPLWHVEMMHNLHRERRLHPVHVR